MGRCAYLVIVPGVVGLGFVLPTMTLAVAVQLLASVTVKVYVPDNNPVGLADVDE
jgi:hypothetical protein